VLRDCDPISFVLTTDAVQARQFYVDVLGLTLVEESPFAVVVRSGTGTIRVTPVEAHTPSPATVLGWMVPDARAVLTELANRGVVPIRYDTLDQDEYGLWRSPSGAQVAWFADPDGNTLSITQC
jgi:catechol 2,3-dioxygenase-like lactoylglutathione lyase family enzyme